jgi:hypothetical protein
MKSLWEMQLPSPFEMFFVVVFYYGEGLGMRQMQNEKLKI